MYVMLPEPLVRPVTDDDPVIVFIMFIGPEDPPPDPPEDPPIIDPMGLNMLDPPLVLPPLAPPLT